MNLHRISIVLILCVGMWTGACKGKSKAAEESPPATQTPAADNSAVSDEKATAAPKAPAFEFRGPGERLAKSIGSWTLSGAPRYFGPETLYDLINGGAEVYTAYGLKEMVTADYTSTDKPKVTVTAEIYDLGNPLNAFGRFSKFLHGREDPSAASTGLPESIGGRGLFGGASTSFWKGPYLVNLTLLDESDGTTLESMTALGAEVLPPIAKALDDGIIGETALPTETTLFPDENRVPASVLFEPALLGLEPLGPGFSATYKDGDTAWTLFFTEKFKDAAAASAAVKTVEATLAEKNITARVEGLRVAGMLPSEKAPAKAMAAASVKNLSASLTTAPK